MFGMLDYRAHKLYALLVGPITFILRLFAIFALPLINYVIGIEVSSVRLIQIAITLVASFLIGIPWYFLVKLVIAVPEAIFYFFIDVVPADGRTKDEAKIVVWNGQSGIALLALNKHPSEWTDEVIETVAHFDIFSRFFAGKIRERIYALQEYYRTNPDVVPNSYNSETYLKQANLKMGTYEACITNKIYRGWVISYFVLFLLLLFHPSFN